MQYNYTPQQLEAFGKILKDVDDLAYFDNDPEIEITNLAGAIKSVSDSIHTLFEIGTDNKKLEEFIKPKLWQIDTLVKCIEDKISYDAFVAASNVHYHISGKGSEDAAKLKQVD